MHKNWIKMLSVAFVAIVIASCGTKKTGTESLVHQDAAMVMTFNGKQLMNKLASGGISADDMSSVMDSTFKALPTFWKDESKTGVDFSQPFVMAIQPGEEGKKQSYMSFIVALRNKDSFEIFMKKNDVTIEKGGTNFMTSDDETVIGYNNKYAVLVQPIDDATFMKASSNFESSRRSSRGIEFTTAKRKELIKDVLQTSSSKCILNNSDYNKISIASNDIKIWYNQELLANNNQDIEDPKAQMITRVAKDLYKGSSGTIVLNFENGKVTTTNQMYFNKDVAKIITKTPPQSIDFSLLQNYPGKTLNGVMGMSINPNMLMDMAKFLNKDGEGMMAGALQLMGLTTNDVMEALTGDVLMVLSDLEETTSNLAISRDRTKINENLNFGFIAKVKDKAKLEKILAIPNIASNFKKEGNIYVDITNEESPMYLYVGEKTVFGSPNKKLVETYSTGTATNTFNMAQLDVLKGKSIGYYFDISSANLIMDKLANSGLPIPNMGLAKNVISMFTNTYMASGNFKDNYIETNGSLNLTRTNVNSLVNMIKSGVQTYIAYNAQPNRINSAADIDLSDVGMEAESSDRVKPMPVR